jgi:hypothetical protein
MVRTPRVLLTALLLLCTALATFPGCGGLPAAVTPTAAILVFAAFEGTASDAPYISSVATVICGGVRGQFNGPSGHELILRNIPFGSLTPPQQPLTVTAPGYRTVSRQVTLEKEVATFVDVSMEKVDLSLTGTVSGVVKATTGEPLVNALVTFSWLEGSSTEQVQGFTDRDGKFIIGGINAGEVTAEAVASGYLPQEQSVTITADSVGTNADLSFGLLSGETKVTVKGVVLDLRTEEPLAGATVTVDSEPSVTSGSDGRFSVPGVLVGDKPIAVRLSGYDDYDDTITVLPGMSDVKVVLSRTSTNPPGVPYTIAGTVTLRGRPDNSGAVVSAYDLDRGMEMASYTTAADGRYYLFVPAGRYEITATVGSRSISRTLEYGGSGRIVDGIDFTLTITP